MGVAGSYLLNQLSRDHVSHDERRRGLDCRLRSEPGAAVVLAVLATPGNTCHAHDVNLCEVFYVRARHAGEETAAAEMRYLLGTAGILGEDEGIEDPLGDTVDADARGCKQSAFDPHTSSETEDHQIEK